MRRLCLALFFGFGFFARGEDAVQALPDEAIQAYLQSVKVPAITVNAGTRFRKEFEAKWFKWCQRVILDPFAARLTCDAATKEKALHVATQGILLWRGGRQQDPAFDMRTLGDKCAELVAAGVDDPVICWLQSWAVHEYSRDFPASEKIFKHGLDHKGKMPSLKVLMISTFIHIIYDSRQWIRPSDYHEQLVETAKRSLKQGEYLPDEDDVMVANFYQVLSEPVVKSQLKKVQELCVMPELTDWGRLMLTGEMENSEGWNARGHGWASEVTDAGWAKFESHLAKGMEAFSKAQEMHPDRPEAISGMLNITCVNGPRDGKSPEEYFIKATQARFDDLLPYRILLNRYLPRWGGSHPHMLALGLACAATHRYDTEVPYFFFTALAKVLNETSDWEPICKHPIISAVAVALSKQLVHDAKTPYERECALGKLGIYAWACGDYQAAKEAFAQLPGAIPRPAILIEYPFREPGERVIRGESDLLSGPNAAQWKAAQSALQQKDYERALQLLDTIQPKATGAGADLVESTLLSAQFERDFSKGAWVKMNVAPKLLAWNVHKGQWEAAPEGVLVNHGGGATAFITYNGRVGGEFQMRGEYEQKDPVGLGFMLGHGWEDDRLSWLTCLQEKGERDGSVVWLLNAFWSTSMNDTWVGYRASKSSFLITCHEGRVTYAINGHEVLSNCVPLTTRSVQDQLTFPADGQVGFTHRLFPKGCETRIRNLEIRKLPLDWNPEPAPAATVPAKDVKNADDLLKYLDDSIWKFSATADGPEIATAFFYPEQARLTVLKGKYDRNHYPIEPLDAKTLNIERGKHQMKFSDDLTHFELTDWPEKGRSRFGALQARSESIVAGQGRPFDFTDTTWKRGESTIRFKEEGNWQEDFPGKKPTIAKWKAQSDREAVVFITDSENRHFTISKDGKRLVLDIDWVWDRVP